jgi:putative nucleotidyltransferase with HDIG domain
MLEGIPCLRKDGTVLFADIKTSGALLDGIKCNVGFFTNVSERIRADRERRQNTAKLLKAMDDIIKVLAMTVEVRDPYTSGHQQRVSSLSTSIAHEIGLPAAQIEGIRIAGIVHDIGKMYVPSEILSKPGQLTEIEFSMIKMHSQAGYDILKIVEFPWPIAQTVLQHHERMDGSGYPGHLLGKDIILEARILAVADVVEAMASHRPYRPALGIDKALEEIAKKKGILYDTEVVDACLKVFNEEGFKFEGEIADRNKVSV